MASLPGVETQLASVGPQDDYIRSTSCGEGEAVFAPFRGFEYSRVTRHATEDVEVHFDGNGLVLGKLNSVVIPRGGDMLGNVTLEIRLPVVPGARPEDLWCDAIGYVLLRRVRVRIDDVIISDSERLWYDISDRLFLSAARTRGVDEMIGRNRALSLTEPHVLYVPLKVFSGKNHHATQNFMPLLASPGTSISLEVDVERFENCVRSFAGNSESQSPLSLSVTALAQYVYLEDTERERMINRQRDILIETEQDVEAPSFMISGESKVPLEAVKLDLSEVNYPVKALVWVAYDSSALSTKQYFRYSDQIASSILLLDGTERYNLADDGTTNLLETYYRGRNCVSDSLHAYSFALDFASWQPSGHLTFGEVRKPVLQVHFKQKTASLVVKCFVVGYRYLSFEKGRVRVLFQ